MLTGKARRQKSTSSADRPLTFAPDANGHQDPKATKLLLVVARKAKIPGRSHRKFNRQFGSIIDESNRIRIGRRRVSGNEINRAFDRIAKSVQRLHTRLLALESCSDFSSAEYFVALQVRAHGDIPDSRGQRLGIQHSLQVLGELTSLLERSKKSIAPLASKVGRPTGGNLAFDTFIANLWLAVRSNGGQLTEGVAVRPRNPNTAMTVIAVKMYSRARNASP